MNEKEKILYIGIKENITFRDLDSDENKESNITPNELKLMQGLITQAFGYSNKNIELKFNIYEDKGIIELIDININKIKEKLPIKIKWTGEYIFK